MRCIYVFSVSVLIAAVINKPLSAGIDIVNPSAIVINGFSRHIDDRATTKELNENNYGLGLVFDLPDRDNLYATTGFYKNTFYKASVYAGIGLKQRFGHRQYIEPGIVGGLVTGYVNNIDIILLPYLTFGDTERGSISILYGPKTNYSMESIMINLSIPLKH
jgi:hypothetical protein